MRVALNEWLIEARISHDIDQWSRDGWFRCFPVDRALKPSEILGLLNSKTRKNRKKKKRI